jgi:transcriptional regulator with XRE-family HTH domain
MIKAEVEYRIRAWRKARGMKQEELAKRVGKSVQTISSIERGKLPRPSTLEALIDFFGVGSADDLRSDPPTDHTDTDQEIDNLARTGRIIGIISQIAANDYRDVQPLFSVLRKMRGQYRTR